MQKARKEKAAEETRPEAAKPPAAKTVEVRIDIDNIGQRILSIPMPARRYIALQAGRAGTLFAIEQGARAVGRATEEDPR